jgi:hypothetical protein
VSDTRAKALEDVERLLEGAKSLRADLRAKEACYRRVARHLEQGTGVAELMRQVDTGSARRELTASLDHFEHSRHQSRLSLIAAGLEEGMTIGQLGRSWGFSRQLAARYAKEARA